MSDYSNALVSPYWASSKLDYHFYANPFDSQLARFDEGLSNIPLTLQEVILRANKNLNYERQKIYEGIGEEPNIPLPAILTVAIMESENIEDILRNVISMRSEATQFRKKMLQLTESKASLPEIIDALDELKTASKALGNVLCNAAQMGAIYIPDITLQFCFRIIVLGLTAAHNLVPTKKNFLKQLIDMSYTDERGLTEKITKIFSNSGNGYKVDGGKVLECIRLFQSQ